MPARSAAAPTRNSDSVRLGWMPMVEQTAEVRHADTRITADAGYYSDESNRALHDASVPGS